MRTYLHVALTVLAGIPTVAQSRSIEGVAVECGNEPSVRMGEDGPPSREAGDFAEGMVRNILGIGNGSRTVAAPSEVPAVYFSAPDRNGNQLRRQGMWPVSAIRQLVSNCVAGQAVSLGREGDREYGYVAVRCESPEADWQNVRLGFDFKAPTDAQVCMNVGAAPLILMREE